MPTGAMTRREFVGWMLASVAAIVAGSQVWRLFRGLVDDGEAGDYVTSQFVVDQHGRGWSAQVSNAIATVTGIDPHRKTITVSWCGIPALRDDDDVVFANA